MSFEKRNYISEQTVITAKNLNDIQDELIRQAEEIPTDSHINELIDTRLGVIENGAY